MRLSLVNVGKAREVTLLPGQAVVLSFESVELNALMVIQLLKQLRAATNPFDQQPLACCLIDSFGYLSCSEQDYFANCVHFHHVYGLEQFASIGEMDAEVMIFEPLDYASWLCIRDSQTEHLLSRLSDTIEEQKRRGKILIFLSTSAMHNFIDSIHGITFKVKV